MTQKFKFVPELRIRCPFCDSIAQYSKAFDEHGVEIDEVVMHSEPQCTTFKEHDAADYIHEVHEILMKSADPRAQQS